MQEQIQRVQMLGGTALAGQTLESAEVPGRTLAGAEFGVESFVAEDRAVHTSVPLSIVAE